MSNDAKMPDLAGLLGSLSGEEMEGLKNAAMSLLSGASGEKKAAAQAEPENPAQAQPAAPAVTPSLPAVSSGGAAMPDLSRMFGITSVLGELSKKDERTEFIAALKPLLSESRRGKADEAARLIKLINIIPALHEQGIL